MAALAPSYPVLWSEADGTPTTGQLTPGADSVELDGSRDGVVVHRSLAYRDVTGIRIDRTGSDLLDGRPTLVLESHDTSALLIRPLGPGLLAEVADVLTELCRTSEPVEQIAVVLPLRPEAVGTARALVAEGPPFEMADTSLDRHEVFVVGCEAIFVFTGHDACDSVRRILHDATVWPAAERWRGCLAGPPRLAEASYAWQPASDCP